MKKYHYCRVVLFFGLLISSINSIAQKKGQARVDSLLNELKSYKPPCSAFCINDSSKVNLLNELAVLFNSKNVDTAKVLSTQALNLSEKINWKDGIANSCNRLGVFDFNTGRYISALVYQNRAYKLYEELRKSNLENNKNKYDIKIARTLNNMANIHVAQDNYSKGLEYYLLSLQIKEKIGNKIDMEPTVANIGSIYSIIGDYEKAFLYYKKTLALNIQTGNKIMEGHNYENIGSIYTLQGDHNEALKYYIKALNIMEENKDSIYLGSIYNNIGVIYRKKDELEKALTYYLKAKIIDERFNNKRGLSSVLNDLGYLYLLMKDYTKAEESLQKSLYLSKGEKMLSNQQSANKNLSLLYSELKDFSKSLEYYKAVAMLGDSIYNKDKTKEITRLEMNYEFEKKEDSTKAEGDKKEALAKAEYDKQIGISKADKLRGIAEADKRRALSELNKNLALAEADRKITEAETNKRIAISEADKKRLIAEVDKKTIKMESEKQIADSKVENERQKLLRNSIAGGAGVVLLSSLLIFLFYKRKRDADQKQKETSLKLDVAETEMKALRSQMNPHFIFNALQSIQTFLMGHQPDEANTYLLKFSKLMRLVLENSQHSDVSIKEDMQALELYMQLERIRLTHPFTYAISIDEDIDQEQTNIPPLILQPFVENAIWHGLQSKETAGHIQIGIHKTTDFLFATVEDDGVGRIGSKKEPQHIFIKKESLGMKLTAERLKILNERKNADAQFTITDLLYPGNRPAGTRVELSLPLF